MASSRICPWPMAPAAARSSWASAGASKGLSRIERTSSHSGAPVFDATDVYKLDDSELVACTAAMVSPSCDNGGTHATRIESYRRITRNASNNSWTVTDRDGTRYDYYPLTVWRAETGNLASQFRWLLARVTDTHNNVVSLQLYLRRRRSGLLCQHGQL